MDAIHKPLAPPGNHRYVRVSPDGSILPVGNESWRVNGTDARGGPSGLELCDVSTVGAQIRLAEMPPTWVTDETRGGSRTTAHNFDFVGDRQYGSWHQGGVKIHDVSDLGEPREIAWWRKPDEAAFKTSKRATDAVVVSSTHHTDPALDDALYTFPSRAGDQSGPPAEPASAPPTA